MTACGGQTKLTRGGAGGCQEHVDEGVEGDDDRDQVRWHDRTGRGSWFVGPA
jgi:hypothetical protein